MRILAQTPSRVFLFRKGEKKKEKMDLLRTERQYGNYQGRQAQAQRKPNRLAIDLCRGRGAITLGNSTTTG